MDITLFICSLWGDKLIMIDKRIYFAVIYRLIDILEFNNFYFFG